MTQNSKITNAFQIGLTGGLGVLLALVIGGAIASTAAILTYVAAAIFIALGLDPLVRGLINRKVPRAGAVAIVVIGFLGLIALALWAILPSAIAEATRLVIQAPDLVQQFANLEAVDALDEQLGGVISGATENLIAFVSNSANWPTLLGGVFQVGLTVLTAIIGTIIVVILSLYFMASLESMKGYATSLVAGSKREKFAQILNQVANSVGRWVIGQATSAALHAVALFIFLSILQAPYALLLASLSLFLAFIPLVGSAAAGVLVTLVSLLDSPTTALIVAIYYLVYLQLEAYLINPRIMRKAVSVPSALVVIAALMGGTLLGVLGALVAIPVAASVLLIVREVWIPKQQLR